MREVVSNSDFLGYSFICSLISSVMLSILFLIFFGGIDSFGFLSVLMFSLIFFIFYLVFGTPLQIILNKKPKKFSIVYLFIYLLICLCITAVLSLLGDVKNPLVSLDICIFCFLASLIFWICDSFFLQDESL
ncbi:hypothetical protein A3863_16390 [Priestia endophytica]|uniref:Uncharacterized protein n=2 Tax=Priestia endophytica TaxID=135735 RepID=A0AAX1Q6H9_9BACI|nr:hypothetical protein A3864_18855 [Priestia endophytica]RAS87761.1 hypothetical protein A3863_16390 [Priestia endophytica]